MSRPRALLRICVLAMGAIALHSPPAAEAQPPSLLVSDRITNRILQYDLATGGFQREFVGPGNPLSGNELDEPTAMALLPSNEVLVANRGSGRVVRYDLFTGEYLGDFATGLAQPADVLVDNGKVFISSLGPTGFDGELVYRFHTDGTPDGSFGAGTGATGRTGMALGSDGLLYVGSFFDGRVLRFDPVTGAPVATNPLDSTGTFGSIAAAGFGTGYLDFDNDGDLLVVGLFSFNLLKLDGTDGSLVGQVLGASAGLVFPADILALDDGSFLINSIGNDDPNQGPLLNGFIGKFDQATGAPINPLFISGAGGLVQPTAMLVVTVPEATSVAMIALVMGVGGIWIARRRNASC